MLTDLASAALAAVVAGVLLLPITMPGEAWAAGRPIAAAIPDTGTAASGIGARPHFARLPGPAGGV